jgi:hypothetical protein
LSLPLMRDSNPSSFLTESYCFWSSSRSLSISSAAAAIASYFKASSWIPSGSPNFRRYSYCRAGSDANTVTTSTKDLNRSLITLALANSGTNSPKTHLLHPQKTAKYSAACEGERG